MFYSILRANDKEEETWARQDADAEAHRIAYQRQTTEEKLEKQEANSEAHSRARQNETEEHHQSRNAKDATAKRIKANKK